MKPSEIKEFIRYCVNQQNGQKTAGIHIWGPPGVGKSEIVKQVAMEEKIGFVDLRMTLMDPTDLRGIPIPMKEVAKWLPPEFLPTIERDGEKGILLLDELNAAPPLVQASGYQLVLDKRVGEYTLPPKWLIIAAGNRQGDRAVVHRMPSPLANRFVHIDFTVNLEDWTTWAIQSDIRSEVIAFIQFRPQLLFAFTPERDERAFPTPRSWQFASQYLDLPRRILPDVLVGAVGEGAAAEFYTYLDCYKELPDLAKIFSGEDIIPSRPDIKFATITALVSKSTSSQVSRLVQYSLKLETEFSVLLMKMLISKDKTNKLAVAKSPSYSKWVEKFGKVLREALQ